MVMKNRIFVFFILLVFSLASIFSDEKKEFILSEFIDIGLKNNPLIAAQQREVEAKKAAYQASKRLFNPGFEYHRGKGEFFEKPETRDTEGFSIRQPLENPFKRHHRIQMFEKDWEAAEHVFAFLKLEVIYEIKNVFYKILSLLEEEELAKKNVASIKEIHLLIDKRAKLGEVKELEAIKLHVEILKAQNEWNKIQTELKLAKEHLNKFLGNSLPEDFSVRGKLDYIPLEVNLTNILNKVLPSHPLIKEKEKDRDRAKSNLSYVKWQRFPDFTLSGFYHKELDGKNKGIGISFDIPLWNFKSKEIAEAENIYLKKQKELKALKMKISTEVKSKFNQLRLSEQALKLFHEGLLKQAQESLKISEVSYKQGEISLIDYLDSQRTYFSILKDYQDSLYDWNADKAALEKAIGEELK